MANLDHECVIFWCDGWIAGVGVCCIPYCFKCHPAMYNDVICFLVITRRQNDSQREKM